MASNIVITGGCGFVGSHLAERLIQDGIYNKIYIVDNLVRTNGLRNINHLLQNFPDKIEFIHGDASTFDFGIIPDVYAMFHLAATRINRCVKYTAEGHRYIADSGFNVVNHCARNNIFLYFASSASVYDSPKRFPIVEEDPCIPPTLYGSSKLYTEHLCGNFQKMFGLKYVVNRYFSVYGPRMDSEGVYTEVIFNWLKKISKNDKSLTVYGDPNEKVIDLVYVSDVVDAILASFIHGTGTYNVSTETGTTLQNLISVIANVTNKTLVWVKLPENRQDIEKKRVGSTEKLRSIGWKPKVSLEEGIKKTYEWIASLERT